MQEKFHDLSNGHRSEGRRGIAYTRHFEVLAEDCGGLLIQDLLPHCFWGKHSCTKWNGARPHYMMMASPSNSSCDDEDDDEDEGSDCDDDVDVESVVVDFCRSSKDDNTRSPTRKLQSYYGVHRDKESFLEELHALQEAFQDQKFHFQAHKEPHNAMQAENSRLESRIQYLETTGLEAPRTGTLSKLKSKRKGCEFRLVELQKICATNAEEVRKLRSDTQFTTTQEVTVERDVFALEVRRLQRLLFHLNNIHKKVCDGNKMAVHVKKQIGKLTANIQELETSVSMKRESSEDMTKVSEEWIAKGAAAKTACANEKSRFRSLQEESKNFMDMLLKEKRAKAELTTPVRKEKKEDPDEHSKSSRIKTDVENDNADW